MSSSPAARAVLATASAWVLWVLGSALGALAGLGVLPLPAWAVLVSATALMLAGVALLALRCRLEPAPALP